MVIDITVSQKNGPATISEVATIVRTGEPGAYHFEPSIRLVPMQQAGVHFNCMALARASS